MVILLVTPRLDEAPIWRRLLLERLPQVEVRVHPDEEELERVEIVLAWRPPPGLIARLPRVRLVCSLGMGVDHLLSDPSLPPHVPVVRLVDPHMVAQMVDYALYAVLHFPRGFDRYRRYQAEQRWEELPLARNAQRTVGILGLGAVGRGCAEALVARGFRVRGWSRTPKDIQGVECFAGAAALQSFLAGTDIVVLALPSTSETAGLVDAGRLAWLPSGACLVNIARGDLVVEDDLLRALDDGSLAAAVLDVVREEPLPPAHPFWTHPRIVLTPHVAGITDPYSAIEPIVENIRRLCAGLPLRDLVDRTRGY